MMGKRCPDTIIERLRTILQKESLKERFPLSEIKLKKGNIPLITCDKTLNMIEEVQEYKIQFHCHSHKEHPFKSGNLISSIPLI